MKITWGIIFMLAGTAGAYCGGLTESDLVNSREFTLEHIDAITIAYSWENITLRENETGTLIIKEYMSIDNRDYYANIAQTGNTITIEKGKRPFGLGTGILFNTYNARVEVYLPASYTMGISVKTSSGNISGGMINGSVTLRTRSGNITIDHIDGDISAESSSGNIKIARINGDVSAESSSGNIRCGVTENAAVISLAASSGNVSLSVPRNFMFRFQSQTSSGSVSTPFSERLFSPVSNRHITEGIVGDAADSAPDNTVHITTTSGSIKVQFI